MMHNSIEKYLKTHFHAGIDSFSAYFAPGRVNLIGEHTDYNGGLVLPIAIQLGTWLFIRKNNDAVLNFYSMNMKNNAQIGSVAQFGNYSDEWYRYPLGIFQAFRNKGIEGQGFDMVFCGDLPTASGLSSSASIEMVTAIALNDLYETAFPSLELVKMAQWAENHFVGVQCGIMDMFASGMGKANNAIYLDCSDLSYRYINIPTSEYQFVITNSMKKRGLTDSAYNDRVRECRMALDLLNIDSDFHNLSEISPDYFQQHTKILGTGPIYKRARHIITENDRVRNSAMFLKKGLFEDFGRLMSESHQSLKTDYEVSGIELDTLVDAAINCNGVLGSRMTGAGFGGCTISLVHRDAIQEFIDQSTQAYQSVFNIKPEFYPISVHAGASKVQYIIPGLFE